MSSIIRVAVHVKQEAGAYFSAKENTPHAPDLRSLAHIAVETSLSSTRTVQSNSGIIVSKVHKLVQIFQTRK
jgi:hypothetical protein